MGRFSKGELSTAIDMLRRNRGRSVLTMGGIIIGVASVVIILSIGVGVQQQVTDQAARLGNDLITIRSGQITQASPLQVLGQASPQVTGALSDADMQAIQKTHGLGMLTQLSLVNGGVVSGSTNQQYSLPVIGTTANLPTMLHQTIAYGTFFDYDATASNKVVLGAAAAQVLFDQNVPLGQTVTILGHEFIVAGIFDEFQTAPLSLDVDFNNAVFIASDTAQSITNNTALTYELLARPSDGVSADGLADRLSGALLAAHGGQHDFSVLTQTQTIMATNTILQLFTGVVGVMATIALLVGGVGVMNVMLVSVTERMHEIGIRKAVGATNRQILWQFMIEAAALSVTGGVLGVLVAGFAEITLRLLTNIAPVITWGMVIGACLASTALGVLFGSFPALKAARKEPISALRNE